MNGPQPVPNAVADSEVRHLWRTRAGIEDFLSKLRSRGAGQLESIKALRSCEGISLAGAKEKVHFSQTWADQREASEALHEAAYEALEILRAEQDHADSAEHAHPIAS